MQGGKQSWFRSRLHSDITALWGQHGPSSATERKKGKKNNINKNSRFCTHIAELSTEDLFFLIFIIWYQESAASAGTTTLLTLERKRTQCSCCLLKVFSPKTHLSVACSSLNTQTSAPIFTISPMQKSLVFCAQTQSFMTAPVLLPAVIAAFRNRAAELSGVCLTFWNSN